MASLKDHKKNKTAIRESLSDYSLNLYGASGTGKSTFMSALVERMGDVLVLGFEDRFSGIDGIHLAEFANWKEFEVALKDWRKEVKAEGLPFDCCVLDTMTSAWELACNYAMDINDWETMNALPYGECYSTTGAIFRNAFNTLTSMGFKTNFVSHEKQTEAMDSKGNLFNKTTPSISNQLFQIAVANVDFILYLETVTDVAKEEKRDKKRYVLEGQEKRRLWFKNNAGKHLKVSLFGFPDYIEYTTVEEGVDKFMEAFSNAVETTKKMKENGESIVNPNADNDAIVEFVEPKVVADDEEESIDELKEKAVKIRDSLLKDNTREEVIQILTKNLGSANIGKCSDVEDLKEFIKIYEKQLTTE